MLRVVVGVWGCGVVGWRGWRGLVGVVGVVVVVVVVVVRVLGVAVVFQAFFVLLSRLFPPIRLEGRIVELTRRKFGL